MRPDPGRKRHRGAVGGLAILLLAGQASATGYAWRKQSALGQGAALAGTATRRHDPGMMVFNPAAMAWLPGTRASLVGSGIFSGAAAPSAEGQRNAALGGLAIGGSPGGDIGFEAFVPAGYATTAPGSDWRVGGSFTTPLRLLS